MTKATQRHYLLVLLFWETEFEHETKWDNSMETRKSHVKTGCGFASSQLAPSHCVLAPQKEMGITSIIMKIRLSQDSTVMTSFDLYPPPHAFSKIPHAVQAQGRSRALNICILRGNNSTHNMIGKKERRAELRC